MKKMIKAVKIGSYGLAFVILVPAISCTIGLVIGMFLVIKQQIHGAKELGLMKYLKQDIKLPQSKRKLRNAEFKKGMDEQNMSKQELKEIKEIVIQEQQEVNVRNENATQE